MQINEVKVFKAKAFQHFVQLLGSNVFAVLVRPEFGCNPDAVTRYAAVLDGATYAALVAVGMGCINVPVTGPQGCQYGVVRDFPVGDGVDAESELRNHDAVVKGKSCLVHG